MISFSTHIHLTVSGTSRWRQVLAVDKPHMVVRFFFLFALASGTAAFAAERARLIVTSDSKGWQFMVDPSKLAVTKVHSVKRESGQPFLEPPAGALRSRSSKRDRLATPSQRRAFRHLPSGRSTGGTVSGLGLVSMPPFVAPEVLQRAWSASAVG